MRDKDTETTRENFEAIATGGESSQALTGLSLSPNVRGGVPNKEFNGITTT